MLLNWHSRICFKLCMCICSVVVFRIKYRGSFIQVSTDIIKDAFQSTIANTKHFQKFSRSFSMTKPLHYSHEKKWSKLSSPMFWNFMSGTELRSVANIWIKIQQTSDFRSHQFPSLSITLCLQLCFEQSPVVILKRQKIRPANLLYFHSVGFSTVAHLWRCCVTRRIDVVKEGSNFQKILLIGIILISFS